MSSQPPAVSEGSGIRDQGSAEVARNSVSSPPTPEPGDTRAVAPVPAPVIPPASVPGSVAVASHQVAVPSFTGKSLRQAVVEASASGLGLRVVGSGVARDQAPPAGTMVPAGTEVVVQFER